MYLAEHILLVIRYADTAGFKNTFSSSSVNAGRKAYSSYVGEHDYSFILNQKHSATEEALLLIRALPFGRA